MPAERAHIVAVDGPSGIGKSTLIDLTAIQLRGRGYRCRVIANNSAGPFANAIRSLAQSASQSVSLALATAAARAYVRATAEPDVTLCDRYVLSTLVYQGQTGVPPDYLYTVNAPLLEGVFSILLDLAPNALASRRQARQRAKDDWFKKTFDLEDEIRAYRDAARYLSRRGHQIEVFSNHESAELVSARIVSAIEIFISEGMGR